MAGPLDVLLGVVDKFTSKGDTFKEDLGMAESSGNYEVVNDLGYMGKYQFGDARLQDFKDANEGYDFNRNDFINNPSLQEDVMTWHIEDINNYIDSRGLTEYIGKEIDGIKITREGLIAGAHLGGKGGMRKFLESGMEVHGPQDKKDINKTYISDYIKKFS